LCSCASSNRLVREDVDGSIERPFYVTSSKAYAAFGEKPGWRFDFEVGGHYKTMYEFTETYTANDLLRDISSNKNNFDIEVFFSDWNGRVIPRTGEKVNVDWTVTMSNKNIFNDKIADWKAVIVINGSSIEMENLELPHGVTIEYQSRLTFMLEYHNRRQDSKEESEKGPTTSRMVWPDIIGTFDEELNE